VLGVLYAFLVYRSWWKRLAFIAASVVVPILANSLRVYLTIVVAHLTDMRWGTGLDHMYGGRVLFIVILLTMFWIGQRWADRPADVAAGHGDSVMAGESLGIRQYSAIVACLLPLLIGPPALRAAVADSAAAVVHDGSVVLPGAPEGWSGPDGSGTAWAPSFSGAAEEASASYRDVHQRPVDVFVGEYQIGVHEGREMIAYGNYVVPNERESLLAERRIGVDLGDGAPLVVREVTIPDGLQVRVVWLWYQVGTHATVSPWDVKFREGLEFVLRRGATERVISISTRADDRNAAHDLLLEFAQLHRNCLRAGFSPPGCAG
jgi:EpsI family protein